MTLSPPHPETDLTRLCAALEAEQDELDTVFAGLADKDFAAPTPAAGWDVRDQLVHLAFGEGLAALAVHDPAAFAERLGGLMSDVEGAIAAVHAEARTRPVSELLDWWRQERARTRAGLASLAAAARVAWAGPEMSAPNFTRARLMETFAHGQDVRDALGIPRQPAERLYEVAALGVRTRRFAYQLRGMTMPVEEIRVTLSGPGGPRTWGPVDAPASVMGTVLDFCLVVTRRRHPHDTGLRLAGAAAVEWMDIAQAYLGPPEDHRPPGTFPVSPTAGA
jgi:uncharacterized protein (TIGR03084 family)